MTNHKHCGTHGTYENQVPMPIHGRVRHIDPCIAPIVAALNAANIETVASCCGHGRNPGSVILADGRELVIADDRDQAERMIVAERARRDATADRDGLTERMFRMVAKLQDIHDAATASPELLSDITNQDMVVQEVLSLRRERDELRERLEAAEKQRDDARRAAAQNLQTARAAPARWRDRSEAAERKLERVRERVGLVRSRASILAVSGSYEAASEVDIVAGALESVLAYKEKPDDSPA